MKKSLLAFLLFFVSVKGFSQIQIKEVDKLFAEYRFNDAMTLLKKMYSHDSAKIEYYLYMGQSCRSLGHYNLARDYFNKALKVDSISASAIEGIGIIYAQTGDSIDALRWVVRAISIDSTRYSFYNDRGSIYYVMKEYDSAINDIQQALRMAPGNFVIEFNLANTYFEKRDYEKAVTYLSLALKGQKHRKVYIERGQAYHHLNKDRKAIHDFNRALRLKDSDDPYERVSVGEIYYRRARAWKTLGKDTKYDNDIKLAEQNGYKVKK
jgi:tetratricopeptide (TPR) repeat protein